MVTTIINDDLSTTLPASPRSLMNETISQKMLTTKTAMGITRIGTIVPFMNHLPLTTVGLDDDCDLISADIEDLLHLCSLFSYFIVIIMVTMVTISIFNRQIT